MAEASGARIVAAGTHPISHWKDQEITDRVRYKDIVNEMEDLARANLIFGLHVHVGVDDRRDADPDHERRARLPAPPAGAVGELALLVRAHARA